MLKRLLSGLFGAGERDSAREQHQGPHDSSVSTEPDAAATAGQGDRAFVAGDLVAATGFYEAALAIDPAFAHALNNLGLCHAMRGEHAESARCFDALRRLDASWQPPHANLGAIALRSHQFTEAGAHYEAALRALTEEAAVRGNASGQDPGRVELLNAIGFTLQRRGMPDEATARFREVLRLEPGNMDAATNLLFALLHSPTVSPEAVFAQFRAWSKQHEEPLRGARRPHPNARDAARRLRIGYCSGDFYDHAVANFIEPILRNHDRSAFAVFIYATRRHDDAHSKSLRAICDAAGGGWCEAASLDDDALAARIRDDAIDVFVDLSGHTLGHRLPVFARKPAPVQISYLGYPATTGLECMDYRITDAVTDPPGVAEDFHTEKLLRLPNSQWCYRPKPSAPPVSPLPALRSRDIMFGSFNNPSKLNAVTLGLWARVLRELPTAKLTVTSVTDAGSRERIAGMLAAEGVAPARLRVLGALEEGEFWRIREEIDMVLDAYPYNGTTTTCEALWAGLPVITLAGAHGQSRTSASLLTAIGLPQFIASDAEGFVAIARDWAAPAQRARLAALRADLRERMERCGLCDGPGFTRALEALYREAWSAWCAPPASATGNYAGRILGRNAGDAP